MAEKKSVIYEIKKAPSGTVVGTAKTRKGARRVLDRRDAAYGASRHYISERKVTTKPRKAGTSGAVSPPGLMEDVKKPRGLSTRFKVSQKKTSRKRKKKTA